MEAEGWAIPLLAKRAHYFREGRSLCGKWGFFSQYLNPLAMTDDEVTIALKSAIKLSHEHWREHGEPVAPGSKYEEIIIAEALLAALQAAIEKKRGEDGESKQTCTCGAALVAGTEHEPYCRALSS